MARQLALLVLCLVLVQYVFCAALQNRPIPMPTGASSFGRFVSVKGYFVAVSGTHSGVDYVYVFRYDIENTRSWDLVTTIPEQVAGKDFGNCLTMTEDYLAVTDSGGHMYLYDRKNIGFGVQPLNTFTTSDATSDYGESCDMLHAGTTVYVAVGDPGSNSGAGRLMWYTLDTPTDAPTSTVLQYEAGLTVNAAGSSVLIVSPQLVITGVPGRTADKGGIHYYTKATAATPTFTPQVIDAFASPGMMCGVSLATDPGRTIFYIGCPAVGYAAVAGQVVMYNVAPPNALGGNTILTPAGSTMNTPPVDGSLTYADVNYFNYGSPIAHLEPKGLVTLTATSSPSNPPTANMLLVSANDGNVAYMFNVFGMAYTTVLLAADSFLVVAVPGDNDVRVYYPACGAGDAPEGTNCVNCGNGYYSSANEVLCASCKAGNYDPMPGSTGCIPTTPGFYTRYDTPTTAQLSCPTLSTSGLNSAYCWPHTAGTIGAPTPDPRAVQPLALPAMPVDPIVGFGRTIAVDGTMMVIGMPDATRGALSGAGVVVVYIVDNAGAWTESVTLTNPIPAAGDHFGASVDISRDFVVVGETGGAGAVYAYRREADAVPDTLTTTPIAVHDGQTANTRFGASVAINGTFVYVGEPGYNALEGRVHVLHLTKHTLFDYINVPAIVSPAVGQGFGTSITVVHDIVLITKTAGAGRIGAFRYDSTSVTVADTGTDFTLIPGLILSDEGGLAVSCNRANGHCIAGDPHATDDTGQALLFVVATLDAAKPWYGTIDTTPASTEVITTFPVTAGGPPSTPGDLLGASVHMGTDEFFIGAPGHPLFYEEGTVSHFSYLGTFAVGQHTYVMPPSSTAAEVRAMAGWGATIAGTAGMLAIASPDLNTGAGYVALTQAYDATCGVGDYLKQYGACDGCPVGWASARNLGGGHHVPACKLCHGGRLSTAIASATCDDAAVDTFVPADGQPHATETACPIGTSTSGATGAAMCTAAHTQDPLGLAGTGDLAAHGPNVAIGCSECDGGTGVVYIKELGGATATIPGVDDGEEFGVLVALDGDFLFVSTGVDKVHAFPVLPDETIDAATMYTITTPNQVTAITHHAPANRLMLGLVGKVRVYSFSGSAFSLVEELTLTEPNYSLAAVSALDVVVKDGTDTWALLVGFKMASSIAPAVVNRGLVIGSIFDPVGGVGVFDVTSTFTLEPSAPTPGGMFGEAIAAAGPMAVISGLRTTVDTTLEAGSVDVYAWSGGVPAHAYPLTPPDGLTSFGAFGYRVAIHQDGANYDIAATQHLYREYGSPTTPGRVLVYRGNATDAVFSHAVTSNVQGRLGQRGLSIGNMLVIGCVGETLMTNLGCPSGDYSESWHTCALCPLGTYTGASDHYWCFPAGLGHETGTSTGATANTACLGGTYADGYKQAECTPAPEGWVVPGVGGTGATICDNGRYQPATGQASCLDAGQGYFVPDNDLPNPTRFPCHDGYYSSGVTETECTQTVPGQIVAADGAPHHDFTGCTPGTYQPDPGQNTCLPAPAGTVAAGWLQTGVTVCHGGKYHPLPGQHTCRATLPGYHTPEDGLPHLDPMPCHDGTYQNGLMAKTCIAAAPGHYVPKDGLPHTHDIECGAGTYQPQTGQAGCVAADTGFHCPGTGNTEQLPCNDGAYQTVTGQTTCLTAPVGYVVPADGTGHTTPVPCNSGEYQDEPGKATCKTAERGFVAPAVGDGVGEQTPCNTGEYMPHTGQTACLAAPAGTIVPETSGPVTTPTPCNNGTHQTATGQTACVGNAAGHYTPADGQPHPAEMVCHDGRYQPLPGQAECLTADRGYVVAGDDAHHLSQTPCHNGTYQPDPAQASCVDAAPGHYVPGDGAPHLVQIPCPRGMYQSATAATQCVAASPGFHVPDEGATGQIKCQSGKYQPVSGESGCIEADPGHHVPFNDAGNTFQSICTNGWYQPDAGQTWCIAPSPGYHVPPAVTPQTSQTPCDAGTHQVDPGAVSCDPCPAHYTTPDDGQPHTGCGVYLPAMVVMAAGTVIEIDTELMDDTITSTAFDGQACIVIPGNTSVIVPVADTVPAGVRTVTITTEAGATLTLPLIFNTPHTPPASGATITGGGLTLAAKTPVCPPALSNGVTDAALTSARVTPTGIQCIARSTMGAAEITAAYTPVVTTFTNATESRPRVCVELPGVPIVDTAGLAFIIGGTPTAALHVEGDSACAFTPTPTAELTILMDGAPLVEVAGPPTPTDYAPFIVVTCGVAVLCVIACLALGGVGVAGCCGTASIPGAVAAFIGSGRRRLPKPVKTADDSDDDGSGSEANVKGGPTPATHPADPLVVQVKPMVGRPPLPRLQDAGRARGPSLPTMPRLGAPRAPVLSAPLSMANPE